MKFKEYILWSQGDTRTAESPIIIDGERVGERESHESFSYISTVNGICKWIQIEEDIIKKGVEFANEISPSFKLFLNKQHDLLITSHFTDVDDAGRRIVYAFCSRGYDFQRAAERLKEASGLIGRMCNSADIKLLERLHIKKKKKSKTLIIVLILLLLLIILAIILLYHFEYINFNTIESLWKKINNN